MKKYFIHILLFRFLIAIYSCEDDPGSLAEPVNNAPEIVTISASPCSVGRCARSDN